MVEKYEKCFELLDSTENVVVLTGAGVSTLSGIPDFRGQNGFYTSNTKYGGFEMETLLSLGFFKCYPELFYGFANEFLYPMLNKVPSVAHITLAKMQQRGICRHIYTQNIDRLHTKAGGIAYELHGNLVEHYCLECGKSDFSISEIVEKSAKGEVPYCSCGGLIKPKVVFYGENLDEELLDMAFAEFERADVALILGSSLTVTPVSTLPMASRVNHKKLIIVNAQETEYDKYAEFTFPDIAEFCNSATSYFKL